MNKAKIANEIKMKVELKKLLVKINKSHRFGYKV